MRVLFIYSDVGTYLPRHFQHGIGYLSACLKQAGHETELYYFQEDPGEDKLVSMARSFSPDLVALSATTNQWPHLRRMARWLKRGLDVLVVCGGIHATLLPEQVIQDPAIDIVCRGEGEEALVELARSLEGDEDITRIMNLWVKKDSAVIKNPLRPLNENLDGLPWADRVIFDHQRLLDEDRGQLSLLTGRGCPYECSYCANPGLKRLYQGKGRLLRRRSVEDVLEELRDLLSRYMVQRLVFHDDIFTLDRTWVMKFCEGYRAEFRVPFEVNVRVEAVDREMLKALRDAGCDMIKVGVESGSERVRREVMNRPISQEKIIQVFRTADELGLRTWSFNMVGLPGETTEDAEQTLELNRALNPDHMQVSVFYPYPGTKLYAQCQEQGWLSGREVDGYFVPESVLEMPGFPPAEIYAFHRRLIHLSDVCKNNKRLLRELAGRKLYYNFIDLLAKAEIAAPRAEYVAEDYFNIREDVRRVLMVHPCSSALFRVKIPRGAVLRFSIALHPGVYDKPGGEGVIFRVRVGRSRKFLQPLFEKSIDPKRVLQDRRWHDAEIALHPYAGKKLWVEFSTATVDTEHSDYNTAGFANPVVLEAG